jgi:serine/threonine protein phosphatase PrpC
VQISVKGARHNNEDTSFGDGQLFAVFDGHGGKYASQLLRKKVFIIYRFSCGDLHTFASEHAREESLQLLLSPCHIHPEILAVNDLIFFVEKARGAFLQQYAEKK